jgi:hypothetical protein
MRSVLSILCLALVMIGGCRTRAIPEPETIPIPNGLSHQNIEVAILSALSLRPPPGTYDPREGMPEDEFARLVWSHYVSAPGNRSWAVESRSPGRITAVISRARYLLRIAVDYDDHLAKVSIIESTGLDQSSTRIHRKAVAWVLKLESRIRSELLRMAVI